jgi:hypothetical protein
VCEGTAWSAERNPDVGDASHSALLAEHRDRW